MIDTIGNAKLWVVEWSGLSKDALHVHLALVTFLTVGVAAKRPLSSFAPWISVLVLQATNEVFDYLLPWRPTDWAMQSLHDMANTMFWPTLILVLARSTKLKLR